MTPSCRPPAGGAITNPLTGLCLAVDSDVRLEVKYCQLFLVRRSPRQTTPTCRWPSVTRGAARGGRWLATAGSSTPPLATVSTRTPATITPWSCTPALGRPGRWSRGGLQSGHSLLSPEVGHSRSYHSEQELWEMPGRPVRHLHPHLLHLLHLIHPTSSTPSPAVTCLTALTQELCWRLSGRGQCLDLRLLWRQ